MASSYVPPHLRFKGESMDIRNHEPRSLESLSQNSPSSHSATYNDRDILNHFWPKDGDKATGTTNLTTLNASHEKPETLSFVLIYAAGHPKWDTNGIIFTKSSLHLLPELTEKLSDWRAKNTPVKMKNNDKGANDVDDEATKLEGKMKAHSIDADMVNDGQAAQNESASKGEIKDSASEAKDTAAQTKGSESSENPVEGDPVKPSEEEQSPYANLRDIPPIDYVPKSQAPIAVFYTRGHGRYGFRFVGWHTIAKVALLLPRSVELGRLMHQKWVDSTARDRGGRSNLRSNDTWKSDMGREWAVIKLQKMDPASEDCPEEPTIEKYRAPRKKENRADLDPDGDSQETARTETANNNGADEAQVDDKLAGGDATLPGKAEEPVVHSGTSHGHADRDDAGKNTVGTKGAVESA